MKQEQTDNILCIRLSLERTERQSGWLDVRRWKFTMRLNFSRSTVRDSPGVARMAPNRRRCSPMKHGDS